MRFGASWCILATNLRLFSFHFRKQFLSASRKHATELGRSHDYTACYRCTCRVCSLQTGNALAFFLHNVASNPDKQDKLYAEIQKFLPDTSAVPTGETLQNMVYLKAQQQRGYRRRRGTGLTSSGLPQGLPSRIFSSALSRVWWIRSSHA